MSSNTMTREQVFAELERRGVHLARVEFSGGNDEGHAEDITFLNVENAAIEHSLQIYYDSASSTGDAALSAALQQPIYDKWGGFAGDFSVNGQVEWLVPERKVQLDYSESEYVPHTEVI